MLSSSLACIRCSGTIVFSGLVAAGAGLFVSISCRVSLMGSFVYLMVDILVTLEGVSVGPVVAFSEVGACGCVAVIFSSI